MVILWVWVDPAAALCVGTYGDPVGVGPREWAFSYERGTPAGAQQLQTEETPHAP